MQNIYYIYINQRKSQKTDINIEIIFCQSVSILWVECEPLGELWLIAK